MFKTLSFRFMTPAVKQTRQPLSPIEVDKIEEIEKI